MYTKTFCNPTRHANFNGLSLRKQLLHAAKLVRLRDHAVAVEVNDASVDVGRIREPRAVREQEIGALAAGGLVKDFLQREHAFKTHICCEIDAGSYRHPHRSRSQERRIDQGEFGLRKRAQLKFVRQDGGVVPVS